MPRERKNAKKDDGEGGTKAKKRRGSNAPSASGPGNQMLPQSYSDNQTVYASNPFDDMPPHPNNRPPQGQMMPNRMQMGPGGMFGGPPGSHMMGGTVYPPEQNRIKNPANPNAPPTYPCGVCHKEVNEQDQAILCESGCNFWFHRVCTGLSDYAYALLNEEIYAEWVCNGCVQKNIPLVKCKP